MTKKIVKSAFTATLPVLAGYLTIGIAFGLMLEAIGYNYIWAGFMSLTIYAGSAQYMAVSMMAAGTPLIEVGLLTFVINFRHLVYGLSMLDKFRDMGKLKPYMIFSLTDETYALLTTVKAPEDCNKNLYYFLIAVMDHSYWILGSMIGAVAGSLIHFDMAGVEFAMTALFLVIAVEQWESASTHLPALLGAGCTLLSLFVIGKQNMLLPALFAIVLLLLLLRNYITSHQQRGCE